jgi:hypothetical protein
MHKDFAEWYRLAGIEPDGEILKKRWSVIDEFDPKRDGVISLAKMFYRLGRPEEAFLSSFIEAFQQEDPAFKIRDNDHELSILAGAQLVDTISRADTKLADLAALSLVSAAASNARKAPSVTDIPEIAARHLTKRSRKRFSSDDYSEGNSKAEFLEALTELGTPYAEVAEELQRLRQQLEVVSEESNMLWWLFSETSRDENQRWNSFSVPAAAVIAGKELADLTVVLPGPIAAPAFLDRTIRSIKTKPPASVSVTKAIGEVSHGWRQSYADKNCPLELESLLPIGYGIKLSLTVLADTSWIPAFTQATGIAANAEIAPHILAYQVFIESLLCRSWKESK